MLLGEGDIFGEEALLFGGGGCTRSVTAVAEVNESDNAELLYLTRNSFDQVSKRQDMTIISASDDPSRGVSSDHLFGFHKM
jgi:CRP-like cAMP-binding protein